MRLRNYLIAVRDIERSRQFYQELFDMTVLKDFGDNVILAGGLVLQERSQWEQLTGKESVPGYDGELFFETGNLDGFLQKLDACGGAVTVLREVRVNAWGRRAVLLADPDGHVIEVADDYSN